MRRIFRIRHPDAILNVKVGRLVEGAQANLDAARPLVEHSTHRHRCIAVLHLQETAELLEKAAAELHRLLEETE